MLGNERSTVRLRAFKLICRLAKYDSNNKVDENIDLMLSVLDDSKGSIVRQALSDIEKLLLYKPKLRLGIENKLDAIDLSKYKDSMWPLILKDIQCIKASIKHIET